MEHYAPSAVKVFVPDALLKTADHFLHFVQDLAGLNQRLRAMVIRIQHPSLPISQPLTADNTIALAQMTTTRKSVIALFPVLSGPVRARLESNQMPGIVQRRLTDDTGQASFITSDHHP